MSGNRGLVERAMADLDVAPVAIDDFHRRRHRRQRARRIGSSVAVILVFVAATGALMVTGREAGDEVATIDAPARDLREVVDDLEPGRYFIDPDGDPSTPLRVSFTVADAGWTRSAGATKTSRDGFVRLAVTVVPSDADRCDSESARQPTGASGGDLAAALSEVGALDVTAGPRALNLLGYSAVHLQLTVPAVYVGGEGDATAFTDCDSDELQHWVAPILDGAFHGYSGDVGRREELWILDVDGTIVVLHTTISPTSPSADVAELAAMFDSLQIER